MRTAPVKLLVEEVLASLPKPHTEDVIDDVFHAIEHRPEWRQQYEDLARELGRSDVNAWGGFWIANAEGLSGAKPVPAEKSTLIRSYSKLTKAAPKAGKKIKEPEALQLMSDYYRANRAALPPSVKAYREVIIELIMAGFPAEEAFAKAKFSSN